MCIFLQNISYLHPNKNLLFKNISFTVECQKKATLIGNNGSGKSTLLNIIAGNLSPSSGSINTSSGIYYIPQQLHLYANKSVGEVLQVANKLKALKQILRGNLSENNWNLLDDDWDIEERCLESLSFWDIKNISFDEKMDNLSGGEKTKIFLAGLLLHNPGIVLFDEPTNHLDTTSRKKLYKYISSSNATLLIVSHDRYLLDLIDHTIELTKDGAVQFGGNYSFYKKQKEIEEKALRQHIEEKEKGLKKAKKTEHDALERKQRLDSRGKGKHLKMNTPRSMFQKLKNNAENSSSRLKEIHAMKINKISEELSQLRMKRSSNNAMKVNFENSILHTGKMLITAENINFCYSPKPIWASPKSFQIRSGERIQLIGENGSGKSTMIKLLLGKLPLHTGKIICSDINHVYIDQDYSLINNRLTIYELAQSYNNDGLLEHEIKVRLNRFLFHRDFWDRPCQILSGGEKMRLILCCLMISNKSPDLFVLDEPTNNLDIENIEILTSVIKDYSGTLLVVSHDVHFIEEINITRKIYLNQDL
jgi:ATPase subunit of ABC transporter with duplicated ATPase domains